MWKNYLFIVLLLTSCMYLRPTHNSMSDLSQNDWANALVEHPSCDSGCHTEDEFESGHIPNALNMDYVWVLVFKRGQCS